MKSKAIDGLAYVLLFCVLLSSFTRVIPHLPYVPDVAYYGSFAATLLWMVFRGGLTFSYIWVPFLAAIFLSVLVNDIPAYFQVEFRIVAFLAVTFVVGPFLLNPMLDVWKRLLFVHSLTFIRWIVILSFLCKMIGLDIVQGNSGFEGFASQSMLLGPLAGISFIYSLYRFYLYPGFIARYWEAGVTVASFLVVILAGSRAALGSSMLAFAFFYSRLYRHQVMRLGRVLFTVLCLAVLTSGIWWSYTERVREKMEYGEKNGSMTKSRDRLWESRMAEFKAFPVFGVGFASVSMKPPKGTLKTKNSNSGTLEPGSSWLFLLSSMGMVGFLSFFIPFFRILYLLFMKESVGLNGYFLGSLLFLFLFHLFFEGYIIASGAYLCFFLWLLLSECSKIVNINNRYDSIDA